MLGSLPKEQFKILIESNYAFFGKQLLSSDMILQRQSNFDDACPVNVKMILFSRTCRRVCIIILRIRKGYKKPEQPLTPAPLD